MPTAEPLLFVPGAFCDARLYAHQLDQLGDVARPVFVDVPDHDRVEAMAEAILATAPERFGLAGLSLGGILAFEIVRRAPDRVTRLALLATTSELDPPPLQAIRRASIDKVRGGGLDEQVRTVLPMLVAPAALADDDLVATVREMALGVGAERYARQVEAILHRQDPGDVLPRIACPTLVACGRDDVVTSPASHERLAARIEGARLTIIDGAGHLLPIEQPRAVTDVLRAWLAAT
jgi:pimeloyl-ACP methyl ester carboxylesterase